MYNRLKEKYGKIVVRLLTIMVINMFVCLSAYAVNVRAEENVGDASKNIKSNVSIVKVYSSKNGTKIKWTSSQKYSGYILYRKKNNGKYIKKYTTTNLWYVDEDVETGEQYQYRILPYTINDKKIYDTKSEESKVYTAKPLAVKNVKVVMFTEYKFVSWDVNKMASYYVIYRKINKGKWKYLSTVETNSGVYKDYDIDENNKYQYKVAAVEDIDNVEYQSVFTESVNAEDLKGIDVSHHNGVINWKKVKKAGISFAMIRLGYGTSTGGIVDTKLDYNYKNAKKNGIKVGLYLYSYADNIKEAKAEAKFTYNMVKTYGDLEYPIAFDFENTYRNKKKYKSSNTKIITTYCDYLEKRGYDTSVYSYLDFFKTSVNYKKISKYGIWLAKWTFNPTNFNAQGIPNVQMWQYSDKGSIRGISTAVDLNILR